MAIHINTTAGSKKIEIQPELDSILAAVYKEKPNIVFKGSNIPQVQRIPTGIFEFDLATGGGFPRGRISYIYGWEGSTKTAHTYCAIAQVQRMPPPFNKAVYVDLEYCFDAAWAKAFGIDTDKLTVIRPGYGEEAADLIQAVMHANDVQIVVVDSLAAFVATKEIKQSMEDFDVGTSSILIKRMINKILVGLSTEGQRAHSPSIILINQIRYKIGMMFGSPETTPGGNAPRFASVLTLKVKGKDKIVKEVDPNKPSFKEVTLQIIKAKVPVCQSEVEYDFCVKPHDGLGAGESISWGTVSNHLKALGVLEKLSPGWKLFGKEYPTLAPIQDTYEAEAGFRIKLQQLVVDHFKTKMVTFDDTQLIVPKKKKAA